MKRMSAIPAFLLAVGLLAPASAQDEQTCDTSNCALEKRLQALLPRLDRLAGALEAAREDAALARRAADEAHTAAGEDKVAAEGLRAAVKGLFTAAVAPLADGPCAEFSVVWAEPMALEIGITSQNATSAKFDIAALAEQLPSIDVSIVVEELSGCQLELGDGLAIDLSETGPRRTRRGALNRLVDVPRLPSIARCAEIGERLEDRADALSGPATGFWVTAENSESVLLCGRSLQSGAWSVRRITAPDTDALVVVEAE